MEKDLKILEEMFFDDESFEPIGYIDTNFTKEQQQAIKNLIAENKNLKEENEKILENSLDVINNMIPKSKVREKIKEINNRRIKEGECELALYGFQREAKIEVLEELLQEGDK